MISRALTFALVLISIGFTEARAEYVRVAVASNFTVPAKQLAAAFEHATGDRVTLSFGSTGTLYAQIAQGAPHQVFLAADAARPDRAVAEGFAVAESRFVYAIGRLALLAPGAVINNGDARASLERGDLARLAIANPVTAPYGRAALETLTALGLTETYRDRIVRGSNIAQTFQFVATGNADAGFVALSQAQNRASGEYWPVPDDLHAPIEQAAVLLEIGRHNPVALAFLDFLRGPDARAIIQHYGYGVTE